MLYSARTLRLYLWGMIIASVIVSVLSWIRYFTWLLIA